MVDPNLIKFVFNVVDIPVENGRQYPRLGICTGWLEKVAESLKEQGQTTLEDAMHHLLLTDAASKLTVSAPIVESYAIVVLEQS